jgi:hypothetical protein
LRSLAAASTGEDDDGDDNDYDDAKKDDPDRPNCGS